MKHILIFLSIIIFSGCYEVRYTYPKHISGDVDLRLYKNGEFYKYESRHMLGEQEYYGNWTKNKDTVFLHIQMTRFIGMYDTTESVVKELHKGNKDSMYFEIRVRSCSTNSGTLVINGKKIIVNKNGLVRIPKQKIRQIIFHPRICFAGVYYNVADTTANYFQIELKDSFEPAFTTDTIYLKKFTGLEPVLYDKRKSEFSLRRKFFYKL